MTAKLNARIEQIQDRLDVVILQLNELETERGKLESELLELVTGPTVYGFLYDRSGDPEFHHDCYRVYKALTLNDAAEKMASFIERKEYSDVLVDSEADHNGTYVDLYQIGETHPLYKYLP